MEGYNIFTIQFIIISGRPVIEIKPALNDKRTTKQNLSSSKIGRYLNIFQSILGLIYVKLSLNNFLIYQFIFSRLVSTRDNSL